jgi:hypothetical protein
MPVPGTGSGWITYASWLNKTGSYIAELTTQLVVPPTPPTVGDQTIFLFSGLQDVARKDLLQPVLQWGKSRAGGGQYWALGSWFIDVNGHASYSKLTAVETGDILTGVVTITGFNGSTYSYRSGFLGYPDSTMNIQGIDELTFAVQVLEAYRVAGLRSYPDAPSTTLSDIALTTADETPDLGWQITDLVNNCGEHTIIGSDANPAGQIEIVYA